MGFTTETATELALHVFPPSVDFEIQAMLCFVLFRFGAPSHVTYTVPSGPTTGRASVFDWLEPLSLTTIGPVHVRPSSSEYESSIGELLEPLNCVHVTYSRP